MGKKRALCGAAVALWSTTCALALAADYSEEEDLALAYGDKSFVSIATGSRQAVTRAPAVATVISAQDIEAMGATELEQALESVPGLHVSVNSAPYNPIYSVRGIHTGFNPHVLMLVNGIPINNVFVGDRSRAWGSMPLENVARLEVIRGPGSALYGADAFSGVINVITKRAADVKGTEYGLRAGSFATRDAWIQHGGTLGPVAAAFYVRVGKTNGHRETVQADFQTFLDSQSGTNSVSLAPGPVSTAGDAIDARADLAYADWRFRAGFQDRKLGVGTGLADALDPSSRGASRRLYLDLTYENAKFSRDWEITAQVGHFDVKDKPADPAYKLFPPGAFGDAFPDGVIGNPGHYEKHTHFSLSGFYSGFNKHRVRLGTGFRIEDMYKTLESKNFSLITVPQVGPVFVPLGNVVDVSDTSSVFIQPHKRRLSYVFAQDEWTLAQDWTLTAGVRYDRYSDFGSTTNPRLALVWDAAYNVVVKALHGRAFRAPSFVEQYNINNPVALGNPNLHPETIATNELAVSWQATAKVQTNLSLFRYHMRDILRFVANTDPTTGATAQNTGGQTGRGFELEATWDATNNLRLSGSLSVQHSTDDATGKDAGLAPHQRLYASADWRIAPRWQLGGTINHVADRKREPDDSRPQIADYTTVDLTFRREKFAGNWDFRGTVRNLFDRDAREPSLAPGKIPFDLPLPGRAYYVEFRHAL